MSDKYDQLEKLRAEVAEATGLSPDAGIVKTLAGLRLAEQALHEQLVAGQPADAIAEKLTALSRTIADLMPAKKEPPLKFTLELVKSLDQTPDGTGVDGHQKCRRCGWQPPEGEHYSRCVRCGWRSGADTLTKWSPPDDDDPGGIADGGGSNNDGASGGAAEAAPAAAAGRRFGPIKAKAARN